MIIDNEFLQKRPLSKSSLMAFAKSPKHYIQYIEEKKKDTKAMRKGSILDIKLLTPKEFEKKVVIVDKIPGQDTKGYQDFINSFKEQKVLPTTKDELERIDKAIESMRSTPEVNMYLEGMKRTQIELKWHNKKNNLPLIGYADFESDIGGELFLVDLKKTKDADPDVFVRDIYKYGYHLQAAAYLDAYHKRHFKFPYFINICVELHEPFNCSVMFYESKTIEQAKDEFFGILDAFRYCMDNDLFHMGYEFRLMQQSNYFAVRKPGYYRPVFTQELENK